MLSLKNVQVLYDRAIEAVRDVSLDVPAGAIVALLGSNGAGKSTILKAISGVLEQEDGEIVNGSIHLDGAQISGRWPREIVRSGLLQVPEARALFATLTVEENLLMGGFTRGRAECAETIEQIYTLFPRVKERRSQISGYLSGGEQQMVAVGRALMGRPRVLMLDEPSLGLAPQIVDAIFEALVALNRDGSLTILLVEQNARLALEVASYGYILENGRIVDTAIIVYTSGTTGMPKGAMLSHRNMMHTSVQVISVLGLNAQNYSVLCYLPLCHVAERSFSTIMQLLTGCVVSFAESVDTVVVNLREIAPKGFLGVPRIWEKMQQSIDYRIRDTTPLQRRVFEICMKLGRPIAERRMANGGALANVSDRLVFALLWLACFGNLQRFLGINRVRCGFCGGATVSPEVLLFFWILGVPIYQIYGMTESSGVAFMQRPGATKSGCSGLAVDSVAHRIADDHELLLSGPSVFKGYLFDEEATRRAVVDGWLHTGDIVETQDNGEIRIVDRKKDILITSGGKNITPSLIENALKDSPYIREAILLGDGRHFLAALIQIDLETTGKWAQRQGIAYTTYRSLAENERVRELVAGEVKRVNDRFARVENVRKFVILSKELDHDDGELTATMKVRRRMIEQKFRDEIIEIYRSAA